MRLLYRLGVLNRYLNLMHLVYRHLRLRRIVQTSRQERRRQGLMLDMHTLIGRPLHRLVMQTIHVRRCLQEVISSSSDDHLCHLVLVRLLFRTAICIDIFLVKLAWKLQGLTIRTVHTLRLLFHPAETFGDSTAPSKCCDTTV